MKKIIWFLPLIGSVVAIYLFIMMGSNKHNIDDMAFPAVIATAIAVIPYVLARAISEIIKEN